MKLLVIGSESAAPYTGIFIKEGFVVESAASLADAFSLIGDYFYDVIVADIVGMCEEGYRFISWVKDVTPRTGIIILSEEHGTEAKVRALYDGADEYLLHPVNIRELVARVYSIIRRCSMGGEKQVECNGVRIEPSTRRVTYMGNEITLTRKEFELLFYFIRNPRRIITHEMIAEYLWGDFKGLSADCFDFIYSHVKNLRKKLSQAGSTSIINTVYGVGYVVR